MNQGDTSPIKGDIAKCPPADTLSPADRFQELFVAVQLARVFPDSKTFVDCIPLQKPDKILANYRRDSSAPGFDLAAFVHAHFEVPKIYSSHYVSKPGQSLLDHIDGLWDVLTRQPELHPPFTSLLPLPNNYVVPGGRFAEMYYWDSYFTMLGLAESGRIDLLKSMAANFAYLVDTFGHIPNGNRTYYLSRSQPPVFAMMVELFEKHSLCEAIEYLPQLSREHKWWMAGVEQLKPGQANRHVVYLEDGTLLNRFWDEKDTPREEAYFEDVQTAKQSSRPAADVYRDLRAAATSGWDFSSRWCDGSELKTIRTTSILPVDLNCFLWKLEKQIALLSHAANHREQAKAFEKRANDRKKAIEKVFWSDEHSAYFDYDWQRKIPRLELTATTVAPLFVGASNKEKAAGVAAAVRSRLLDAGGIATTEVKSGQQWDQPNGWAPLQWMAVSGFRAYDQCELAEDIAHRWLTTVSNHYERESKLVEKYVINACVPGTSLGGGGGEYPLQDGFGWTNGVTRLLLHERPKHPARNVRAPVHPKKTEDKPLTRPMEASQKADL